MQSSQPGQPARDRSIALSLALFLLAVYLAVSGFHFQSIDEAMTFTTVRSLVGRGTIDADTVFWAQPQGDRGGSVVTGIDGHAYVVKDPGAPLLALPLVWIAHLVAVISPARAALLLSPAVTAITAALIYLLTRTWNFGQAAGIFTALAYGLASLALPYAETLFTQPLAALGLALALIGTVLAGQRRSVRLAALGGLGLGIASVSSLPTLATLPVYILYLIPWGALRAASWRSGLGRTIWLVVAFGIGLAPFGLLQAALNQVRFGNPLITPYQASQVTNGLGLSNLGVAGFGLLLSSPRGLLWYVPLVVLIPFGLWLGWKALRREMLLVAGQALVTIIVYSTYAEWWGGNAWGPRFFVPIMPALTLLVAPLLQRVTQPARWWARALAALPILVSVVMQLLATAFNTLITERRFFDALIRVRASANFLQDYPVLTDPRFYPWRRLQIVVLRGQWDTLWMSRRAPDWTLIIWLAVTVLLSLIWLIMAARRGQSASVGWGQAGLLVLIVAVAALALTRYPYLPDGYTANDEPPPDGMDTLIASLQAQANREDTIIALVPYSYLSWLDRYDGAILDTGFAYEHPMRGLTATRLETLARSYPRLWLVTEKVIGGDKSNGVEQWLSLNAFSGQEESYGDLRLVPYTLPAVGLQLKPVGKDFGDHALRLDGAAFELVRRPNSEWVDVWLRWKAEQAIGHNYTVFVHLLNDRGQIAAQHDGIPQAAYAPTISWLPGQTIDDRHSVNVVRELPAGDYQVSVGLYDPDTGERVRLSDGSSDAVVIGSITIR